MVELFFNMTNLRQATIGAVEGVARGAGNEFLISIDMRFATKGHTLLGLPEVGGVLYHAPEGASTCLD